MQNQNTFIFGQSFVPKLSATGIRSAFTPYKPMFLGALPLSRQSRPELKIESLLQSTQLLKRRKIAIPQPVRQQLDSVQESHSNCE